MRQFLIALIQTIRIDLTLDLTMRFLIDEIIPN